MDDDRLLLPCEAAMMFRVDKQTITKWARAGKISFIKTLGGRYRFYQSEIEKLLQDQDAGQSKTQVS